MRDYELVMVVSPEVADEALSATVERVHEFIRERGGEVKRVDVWGRRRLAYPIRQFLEGHYVITQFRLGPQAVRVLEDNLQLAENVIRHLVVRQENETEGAGGS